MKKFMERLSKDEKGFTLIELIIVVAILAIIAAIAIPNILNAVDNSRKTADVANAKIIAGAAAQVLAKSEASQGSTYVAGAALNVSTLTATSTAAEPLKSFEEALYKELSNNPPTPGYKGIASVTETSFYLVLTSGGTLEVYVDSDANTAVGSAMVYPNPNTGYVNQ